MLPTTNWFCSPSTKRHFSFSENKSSSPPSKAPHQVQTLNSTTPNALILMTFQFQAKFPQPDLTAPIPQAPLINQPLVNNTFRNNKNRVHKVVRPIALPVPNIPNIPLGRHFVPNMSHWRFPQQTVNSQPRHYHSVPPNVQPHIVPSSTNVPLRIYQNSLLLIDRQSPSGAQQENPIAATSNIVPV